MPKRVDQNQPLIVQTLRAVGASVQFLHEIGKGCPDVLVGFRDQNYILEIKNPEQPPSKRKLTPDEEKWHQAWAGQKAVVETPEQALAVIGVESS